MSHDPKHETTFLLPVTPGTVPSIGALCARELPIKLLAIVQVQISPQVSMHIRLKQSPKHGQPLVSQHITFPFRSLPYYAMHSLLFFLPIETCSRPVALIYRFVLLGEAWEAV